MCLKGSPRCYPHAKEAYENAVNKFRDADVKLGEAQASANGLSEGSPAWKKANKQVDACKESADKARAKVDVALSEMNETSGGIHILEMRVQHLGAKNAPAQEMNQAMDTLVKAEQGYAQRLYKYDVNNQTVNGKLPSGYASKIGLEHLNEKKDKLHKSLQKAQESKDTEKTERINARYKATLEQIKHAELTLERIDSGDLSRFNAPPSSALKKTPRYHDYVKTASAARTIAQEHKELAAIGLRADGSANVHQRSSKRPAYDAKMKKIREYKEPLQPGIERPAVSWYDEQKKARANQEAQDVSEGQGELF